MVTFGSANLQRVVTVAVALLVTVSVAVVGVTLGTAEGPDLQQAALQMEADQSANESTLSEANITLRRIAENDSAGWSIAEAGDVNGDGETDLLVGAPRRHNNSTNTGTAYLFYGPLDEGDISLSDANVTFDGPQRADRTGVAVTGGDLDGDGYADVVIGAPHSNNSDDARYAGKVYVVSGGEDLDETVALGNESAVITGESNGDHAGYSLAVVNRSAEESELVVGAPYNNSTDTTAGAVYLIDGDEIEIDAGETQSLSDLGTKYAGENNGDRAGWSVADAGDVNGDGRHDVVVGAYRSDSGADDAGAAYVIYGGDESQNDTTLAEADAKLTGVEANDFTGYGVDGAGDVDGDGLADVIVGAPYNNETGTDAGAAYVVSGANVSGDVSLDDAALKLYGESENDLAGFAVSGGPCNESVYVGAPNADNATGSAYAVSGDATGEVSLAGAVATYNGEARGDGSGFALASATNLSDDGTEELLVGAPFNDSNANDSGAAYLLSDACPTSGEDVTDVPPAEAPDERGDDGDNETTIPVHDGPRDDDKEEGETEDEREDDGDSDDGANVTEDGETVDNATDGDDTETDEADDNSAVGDETDDNGTAENETAENETADNVTDDDPANTTTGNQTGDGTENGTNASTDAAERITPVERDVTIEPGTQILFELSADETVEGPILAEWEIDGDTDYELGPFHTEYRAEGEEFYKQTFTEAGTYDVTATVLNQDLERVGTVEWTVRVEEGANEAPSATPADGGGEITLEEDDETGLAIDEGETVDLTLDVSDPDGNLHRVVWFYGLQDVRLGTTSVSGSQDTATISVERACQCPVIVWVVDESGTVTERTVWNFNITQSSAGTDATENNSTIPRPTGPGQVPTHRTALRTDG